MKKQSSLDQLVVRQTAFRGFWDMLDSLARGYVPTLRKTRQGHKLARAIEAHGFKVFMV
jgi:hypothetical protein